MLRPIQIIYSAMIWLTVTIQVVPGYFFFFFTNHKKLHPNDFCLFKNSPGFIQLQTKTECLKNRIWQTKVNTQINTEVAIEMSKAWGIVCLLPKEDMEPWKKKNCWTICNIEPMFIPETALMPDKESRWCLLPWHLYGNNQNSGNNNGLI